MSGFESIRDASSRAEMVERISRAVPEDGSREALPGLMLYRVSRPTDRVHGVSSLSLCIIAQGGKEVMLGDRNLVYDADNYLLITAELPLTGRVIQASPDTPYLSIRLELDAKHIGSVMAESALPLPSNASDAKALVVSPLDSDLRDAVVRLLRLIDRPEEQSVLLPMIQREITYRILMGPQGHRARHVPAIGMHSHRIAQAMQTLRKEFDRPLRIDQLAKQMGMSSSGFHHHFKAITDMSPLQFQKQLRLQEARRLMLSEGMDASSAGYRVGYDDASHFSRDYKRYFGDSPMRDVERLRTMAVGD